MSSACHLISSLPDNLCPLLEQHLQEFAPGSDKGNNLKTFLVLRAALGQTVYKFS